MGPYRHIVMCRHTHVRAHAWEQYSKVHTHTHTQDHTVFSNELYRNLWTLKEKTMVTERELGTVPDLSPKERAASTASQGPRLLYTFLCRVTFLGSGFFQMLISGPPPPPCSCSTSVPSLLGGLLDTEVGSSHIPAREEVLDLCSEPSLTALRPSMPQVLQWKED